MTRVAAPPSPPHRLTVVLDDSVLRRSDALQEMMRFARSIVADGIVTDAEVRAMRAWIDEHPDVAGLQPVEDLLGILTNVLSDGSISERERTQLRELVERFGG